MDQLPRVFLSWFFIGIWFCFTIKFINLVKYHREFSSPHNTFFFITGSLNVGIFYNFWGNFTGLLEYNLLQGTSFYLSPWVIIFAFPYYVYGLISLYKCFKKYYVVHIGQKSISAQKFGILSSVFILMITIGYLLFLYVFIDFNYFPLKPIHMNPNFMVLFLCFYSFILMIWYGSANRVTSISDISTEASIRPTILQRPTRRVKPTTRTIRPKPTPRVVQPRAIKTTGTIRPRSVKSSRTIPTQKKESKFRKTYKKYIPKAGIITEDNFKCIFCFQLPNLSTDQGRGIILCPNCRHPAHADAFRDWLKSSNLCSRCGATIPSSFRNNPKVIPVKAYLQIYNEFKKRKKK